MHEELDKEDEDPVTTEDELKKKYHVEFSRTPRDERMVFRNPKFVGEEYVWNDKRGIVQCNEVFLVDYLRANSKDFDNPLPGLLTILKKRWENACLGIGPSDLKGKVELTADKACQIVSIRNDLV